jgi:hypothetical protein
LRIGTPVQSGSTTRGILIASQIESAVTGDYWTFGSFPSLATGLTLSSLLHFRVVGITAAPSGGSLTNQSGFQADNNLTGATNNYGFYGNIAAATGRFNFYANGTAQNYFAGTVGIGTTTPDASALLDVQSTTKGVRMPNMTTAQKDAIASPALGLMVFDTTLGKLSVRTASAWETITSV